MYNVSFLVVDEPLDEDDQASKPGNKVFHRPSMIFSQLQYEEGEKLQRECLNHIRQHPRAPFPVRFYF